MEAKINIAEILKDKKNGLRLYSPIFGECIFCYVREETNDICVKKRNGVIEYFNDEGLYFALGEVMLFPSKSMRDWEKFSWKNGDLLINSCGFQCIFKEWESNDYTKFNVCYSNSRDGYEDVSNAETAKFDKLDNNTAYGYVREIERKLGGILNLETLEIEKTHTEFKDGDIVALVVRKCTHIAIFQSRQEAYIGFYAVLCQNDELLLEEPFREDVGDIELRLATEAEKQQLFSALEKEGKQWDSDKKAIVDLKPKCEFKPFDRCIWKIRNCEGSIWQASFVSYVDEYGASPMGMSIDEDLVNLIILPYNDKTKLLVGTTDDWKGGEQ